MDVHTIATQPFDDQKPGTSGLRKTVKVFSQPHYLENFIQSVFDAVPQCRGGVLVLGGDGRHHNDVALQTVVRMAVANGVRQLLVGRDGLLSTPAVSALIRHHGADGGFILSASHNPGGPDGDFGVKFNVGNGGPATESLTNAIYARSREIRQYLIADIPPVSLARLGDHEIGDLCVTVIDSVTDYARLLEGLFDFDRIRDWLSPNGMCFDAMNAVTGPYARAIFHDRLGAPVASILRGQPLPDFGGQHPDPTPSHAPELMTIMAAEDGPAFGAASDGDGDRNLIVGRGCFVAPSDSLAILAANATRVPGYRNGLPGVARSMPTSRAVDAVASSLGIPCYETPTGWKFFSNLLDAGSIGLCGEESFGTSSHHVREKDGLWAVLFWMNLLAVTGMGVRETVSAHWARFGRHVYNRHDYEALPVDRAAELLQVLRSRLPGLRGRSCAGLVVSDADEFTYHDPIDGSVSEQQGLRVVFGDDARIVLRLSGTGTQGATLRIYLERRVMDPAAQQEPAGPILAPLAEFIVEQADIAGITGRQGPSAVV